jgi:uracil-DNA glycosylase
VTPLPSLDLWALVPAPWRSYLASSEAREALERVSAFLDIETQAGRPWHPQPPALFRALQLCDPSPKNLAGAIIGQDPYPKAGQPTGLAFDLPPGQMSPSARAILDELASDLGSARPPAATSPTTTATPVADFSPWASRGILLWNSAATTTVGVAGAHAGSGWHEVTHHLMSEIVRRHEGLVFICWGAHAQKLVLPLLAAAETTESNRDTPSQNRDTLPSGSPSSGLFGIPHSGLRGRHGVICSNHPSPLSARRPPLPFYGSKPFSRFNELRVELGRKPVNWSLT